MINPVVVENEILVLDIETTGFLKQGGKIVEIGIVALNVVTGETRMIFDSLVKEPGLDKSHTEGKFGWIFTNSSLTFEECMQAPDLEDFRVELQGLFDKYHVTAYNKQFDFGFLSDRGFKIKELPCPMIISTPVCELPAKYGGYKWPKVQEAWDFFFGKNTDYIEEHRGLDDAKHEAKIVFELIKRNLFPLKSS